MIRMQRSLYSAFVRAAATTAKHSEVVATRGPNSVYAQYDWLPVPSIYALTKMTASVPVTGQVKMHGAFCKLT